MIGLIGTGIGFIGAAVDPGPGPRTVRGSLTVAHLYLPPLLVGLVALAIAGLIATRNRWTPAVGAVFALILLVGAVTFGSAAVSYRVTHPGAGIGFAEDWLQLVGEAIAIGAGIAVTVQLGRHRLVADRDVRQSSAVRGAGDARSHG
jgi:hypothetical protein